MSSRKPIFDDNLNINYNKWRKAYERYIDYIYNIFRYHLKDKLNINKTTWDSEELRGDFERFIFNYSSGYISIYA